MSSCFRRIKNEKRIKKIVNEYIVNVKDGRIVEDRALGIYPNSVYTLCTLVYDVIGCSIGFKFKQSTLKL